MHKVTIFLLTIFLSTQLYAQTIEESSSIIVTPVETIPIETVETTPIQTDVVKAVVSETTTVEQIPVTTEVTPQVPTIKELITQVKQAPDEEKRLLMNQLKIRLKAMNKEKRTEAIKSLKYSFAKQEETHSSEMGKHQHKHKYKNAQHQPLNHQPKYRHLRQRLHNGQGREQHQGHGNK